MNTTSLKHVLVLLAFLSLVCQSVAQENVFLDRDYWKGNPSIAQVEKDITAGNDITELNRFMFDPVTYALIERTNNATVKYLLEIKGNEVDKLTHDGRTYIFWAAYRDNLEIMEYLVNKGAKANIEDSHGYSVLNFAAVTGQTNPKLYDFLLNHGANIKARNRNGADAILMVASFAKNMDILDYFANKGQRFNSTDDEGNGLFHYASKGGQVPLLKALVDKGISYKAINKSESNAILMASQGTRGTQNSLETYTYLESLGILVNTVGGKGRNPLHAIASRNQDLAIYSYFLDKGVDINKADANGVTPFMNAAKRNSLEVLKFLLPHVADINAKDNKRQSALALAVGSNAPEAVSFLLDENADIHTIDAKGNNLSFYLMQNFDVNKPERFEAKLKVLRKAGLDIAKTQQAGNTLVHLAVKENNLALLKRLQEFGIDINKKNDDGNTALHLAAMTANDESILKYLIEQGADKSLKTDFDESVYNLAVENELLQKGTIALDFLK